MPVAESYEVQLSADAKFTNPQIFKSKTEKTDILVQKPGTYQMRVRPIDEKGKPLTGYSDPVTITYTLKVPLVTPTLLEPADNTTLFFQKSENRIFWVEWRPVRQAENYILEIATDNAFKNVVLTKSLNKNRQLIKGDLPLGNLYWRVKAEGDNKSSSWSAARRMNIFAGRSADDSAREGQ
jgi:hypothetical protein